MANQMSSLISPDLVAAWVQLTPYHQTLVLSLAQALAAEDVTQLDSESGSPAGPVLGEAISVSDTDSMIVAAVLARLTSLPQPAPDAWQQTVGMFGDDPILREITDEGARLRAANRSS